MVNSAWGQVSITSASTINETLTFTSPTAGTAVSGANSPANWTLTATTGNTWRGTAQTTGTSGGWYANNNLSFLGSSSASNAQGTWQLQNNTGTTITGFTIQFVGTMWKTGTASPTVTVSYANNATNANPAAGALTNSLSSLTFSDATANVSTGATLTQTVSSLTIANGDYIYIRWIHPGGSNSDNLGWDTIQFTPTLAAGTTNFYSKSTGNLDVLSNWGTATDGTGTAPTDFTTAGQVFNIRNNATPTIGANWTVSGSNSKIIDGDGTNACNFTIPSNFTVAGTVDVSAAATLTNQNTTNPTLGTLNATSTVDYNGTGAQTVAVATYGNLTISGTRTGTPAITLASGTVGVAGTFSVTESGAVTYVNSGNTVNFAAATTQTIPAINYLNITNTGNGNRTLASTGTIGVAGTFTTGNGTYTTTGSTVNFNGSVAQSLPVLSYNNLTYSGSNTGSVTSTGTFTLATGTLSVSSGTLKLNTQNTGGTAAVISVGSVNLTGGTLDGSAGTLDVAGQLILDSNRGPRDNQRRRRRQTPIHRRW
jgi:hypothetical protein